METRYWAKRGRNIVGPFPSRREAIDAFRAAHPFKGPGYMARAKVNSIMSGYGVDGPRFDLQWVDAREGD